jgi:hypothetical protein
MQVKIVRESMTRMIEAWKEIPDMDEELCSSSVPPSSQARSSLTGDEAVCPCILRLWSLFSLFFSFWLGPAFQNSTVTKKNQALAIPSNFIKFGIIRLNFNWSRFCTVKT